MDGCHKTFLLPRWPFLRQQRYNNVCVGGEIVPSLPILWEAQLLAMAFQSCHSCPVFHSGLAPVSLSFWGAWILPNWAPLSSSTPDQWKIRALFPGIVSLSVFLKTAECLGILYTAPKWILNTWGVGPSCRALSPSLHCQRKPAALYPACIELPLWFSLRD